jgi:hypothetical protein
MLMINESKKKTITLNTACADVLISHITKFYKKNLFHAGKIHYQKVWCVIHVTQKNQFFKLQPFPHSLIFCLNSYELIFFSCMQSVKNF